MCEIICLWLIIRRVIFGDFNEYIYFRVSACFISPILIFILLMMVNDVLLRALNAPF
ncbi:hypothetical protein D083_3034 [Dickeya solani RNS 08.23.3.1.A]|nr:hypothetical protein D083_3034 [Dickeya solani RNS 08.23.3.1.A]